VGGCSPSENGGKERHSLPPFFPSQIRAGNKETLLFSKRKILSSLYKAVSNQYLIVTFI
jgi:hypothetical protein